MTTGLPVPSQALPIAATDATVSLGLPEAGLSTRLDPSTAITQGVVGGRKFGARAMNFILGGLGDWLAYLREAMPLRLSATPRVVLIPIERAVDVTDGTPAIENPAHTSEITGAGSTFGSGNHFQPVLRQLGTSRIWAIDLSDILPKDGLLTEISLQVIGDAAWGAGLPSTLPSIAMQYVSSAGGIDTDPVVVHIIGSGAVDPSTTYGQFQLKHYITLTPGTPIDLAVVGTSYQVRLYLVISGAVSGSGDIPTVTFFNARAKVTSKAWT